MLNTGASYGQPNQADCGNNKSGQKNPQIHRQHLRPSKNLFNNEEDQDVYITYPPKVDDEMEPCDTQRLRIAGVKTCQTIQDQQSAYRPYLQTSRQSDSEVKSAYNEYVGKEHLHTIAAVRSSQGQIPSIDFSGSLALHKNTLNINSSRVNHNRSLQKVESMPDTNNSATASSMT